MRLALIAGVSALALAGAAQARVHRAEVFTPVAACPQGANLNDGCGGQIAAASFQRDPATFPNYATGYDPTITATGLTRAGNIRAALAGTGAFAAEKINFNLPGVQYPVGDNPLIEVQAKNYATLGNGGLGFPAGCSYQTSGGGANALSPRVYCTAPANNPTISNIDLTNGGTDCVTVEASGVTGLLTVNNYRMAYRGQCIGAPGKQNAWLWDIFAPSSAMTGILFKNGLMDSNPPDCTVCVIRPLNADLVVSPASNMTITMDYVAAINNTGRLINGGTTSVPGGGSTYAYKMYVTHSYIEGVSLGCLTYGQHGELTSINAYGTGVVGYVAPASSGNVDSWSYDTIVVPPWQPYYPHASQFHDEGCLTAPLYFSTGAQGAGSSWSMNEDHVLSITNMSGSGNHFVASAATVEISYDNYPNSSDVTVTSVWADPNGAGQCALNAAGAGTAGAGSTSPVMSIVDLYDASVITNFDGASKCNGHANP